MLHTHPVNKNSLFDQPHPLSWQEMYLSPAPEPDTDLHPSDTKDSLYIYILYVDGAWRVETDGLWKS